MALDQWSQELRGQTANMASMSDKEWIDRLYSKTFPRVNLKALHKVFYKPELLLRYVMMFRREYRVVNVMRRWVFAVTEDVRNSAKGKASALFKLRAGQSAFSKK